VNEPLTRKQVGQVGAALFFGSGALTLVSPFMPTPPGFERGGVFAIGAVALLAGVLMWFLPWEKWPRWASLVIVPFALGLIGLHNYWGGQDPYRYTIFFMVAFAWMGMSHRRGTATAFAPLLAACYLIPLAATHHPVWAVSSAAYAVPLCALMGETLSWFSYRLGVAQGALRHSEERFRSLVQNAADIIAVVDSNGVLLYDSPATARILGYDHSSLQGSSVIDIVHRDDRASVHAAFEQVLAHPGAATSLELRTRHQDGKWRWFEATLTNLIDEPSVNGIVANLSDVTDRRQSAERLAHHAYHDVLTGLPNRAAFLGRLERVVQRADTDGTELAVLFLDLDGFKTVNDTLGHEAGDRLLAQVARRLNPAVRPGDVFARLGGDEFTILLDGIDDTAVPARVAQRLIRALEAPFDVDGHEVYLSCSIGIALGQGRNSTEELLRQADLAMYRAKDRGRCRFEVFDETLAEQAQLRLALEADLRHAVERGELRVDYQPEVNLETGGVVGAEALVRWSHPTRGDLGAMEFVPVAEETGLIGPIGRWVLEQACRQGAAWLTELGDAAPRISVNVSGRQLQDHRFPVEVASVLRRTGLPASLLTLEITESVLMDDAELTVAALRALKTLGLELAIDDFGTGYSSLAYLQQFPVDWLKIDRSFVEVIGSPTEETPIIAAMVAMARSLGMEIVAEGIESTAQLEALRMLGCRRAQGFLFGRPGRPDVITEALRPASVIVSA
jgi:diguanylate cyclase (GGDEF)-like protein/PAS domain S-box-containing protein